MNATVEVGESFEIEFEQRNFANSECDEEAWISIYILIEKYSGIFYKTAFSILKRSELTEEVLSQALTKAFEQRKTYNPEKHFINWYKQIVKNTAINVYKREILQIPESSFNTECEEEVGIFDSLGTDTSPGPFELACSNEEMEELNKAMNYLATKNPKQIEVLQMFLKGLKYEEIAKIKNLPIGTVMSRIHGARQNLIQEMTGILEIKK